MSGGRQPNLLRTKRGEVVSFPDLASLQESIVEGRVDGAEEIYDSDLDRWVRVRDCCDLAGFFALRVASERW